MRFQTQHGLAILLVIFLVALASILVVNLTYSTYLGSRLGVYAERSVQAEYLLKSAVNFARVLIKEDQSDEDSTKDDWGKFSNGLAIPTELFGVTDQNVRIEVEIRAEGSKLRVNTLVPGQFNGLPDLKVRGIFERLFTLLKFDQDHEEDASGQSYGVKEMVANLIDYMDPDQDPYDSDDFSGMEDKNSQYPNTGILRLEELAAIPGFTPVRVQKLLPFLTTNDNYRININLVPRLLLLSLHPQLDENQVDQIIAYRNSDDGPFQNPNQISKFVPDNQVVLDLMSMLSVNNRWFQVLTKVDYGHSSYFMRTILIKESKGQLPTIRSQELF